MVGRSPRRRALLRDILCPGRLARADGAGKQIIGAWRLTNVQVHSCQPECLIRIGARGEPEFGCVIGESLWMLHQ